MSTKFPILALLGFAAIGGQAMAAAPAAPRFENLDRIDSIVAMTVGANLGEPGGPAAPVDRRLRLAACPSVPSVEGPVFGAAIVKCDALGWRIRVPLVNGGQATPQPVYGARPMAQAPVARQAIVRKGDPVQLVAGNESFSVTRNMVAEEDGATGDMIRVRQDKNSPIVIARVESLGIVRVPGI